MRVSELRDAKPLTRRWTPMRYHPKQAAYATSEARFCVVPPGRRSGKSEIAKRLVVRRALLAHRKEGNRFYCPYPDPRFFIAAPTVAQVKSIYWEDVIALIPPPFIYGRPNASTLTVRLINGSRIQLLGMDRPERAEGVPWDGGVMDEYGNMKPDAWSAHLRPSLSDRRGWAHFIGVPEGRNHYYDLFCEAQARMMDDIEAGRTPEWATYHWTSLEILPLYNGAEGLREIEQARDELDEITFRQEFMGSFENFTGRAYYGFTDSNKRVMKYDPNLPVKLCLDFNIEPCVGVVAQEQLVDGRECTCVIGEIYLPRGGNVIMVCKKFKEMYPDHQLQIVLYGDATGGSRGTGKVLGSEWELVKRMLRNLYSPQQLIVRVPSQNPRERDRISSVNSRCQNVHNENSLFVDPKKAPRTVKDFEGVCVVKGGSGELDKSSLELTHLSDALGYYVAREFPIKRKYTRTLGRKR